jgi:hypothetical protein
MIRYKAYFIWGTARAIHPKLPDWCAVGLVYSKTPEGFVLEAEPSDDRVFTTKVSAERHGLELCRQWVDEKSALQPS